MSPKANNSAPPTQPSAAGVSGKWVIIGILTVALAAAGGSWWFRYSATHRAAEFWGPQAAHLIRDAPRVDFLRLGPKNSPAPASGSMVLGSGEWLKIVDHRLTTAAPGLIHLRNALLEDRSFDWSVHRDDRQPDWRWALFFQDAQSNRYASVVFSEDCTRATLAWFIPEQKITGQNRIISCQPIAAGLREMFAEMSQQSPLSPADSMSVPAAPAR